MSLFFVQRRRNTEARKGFRAAGLHDGAHSCANTAEGASTSRHPAGDQWSIVVDSMNCGSPAGTGQSVAGHGSARWPDMECESRRDGTLALRIEAVDFQKPCHFASMVDLLVVLALVAMFFITLEICERLTLQAK